MPDPAPEGGTVSSPTQGRILLTGATGFIGRRVQDRLIAAGWHLRVLARSGSARIDHLNPAAELIDGTLNEPAVLGRGLVGTVAVVNCAGAVRGADYAAFEAANVAGVRSLCESIKRLSVPPALLHLSSLAAEQPDLSDYARSKRAGEQVLEGFTDLIWTVIRPPAVYGPGDTEMRPAFNWARRGVIPVAGGDRHQRLSMLHVDDLAGAVEAWLKAPATHRQHVYAIDDGKSDGYDWEEIAAAVSPNKPFFLPLPGAVLSAAARVNELLAGLTGRPIMLSTGKVRELTHPRWVAADTATYSRASGWQPRIALAEGVSGLFES